MTAVNGSNAADGGTRWIYDVTVYPKNATGSPDLEKTVRESKADTGKNQGKTDDISDGYAQTATGSAGDIMDYQIVSTLRGKTFHREGYVQTGWMGSDGIFYELGGVYTTDADVTMRAVWDKILTLSVPFTTTVKLGGDAAPGETAFELAVVDANSGEETAHGMYYDLDRYATPAGANELCQHLYKIHNRADGK